MEDLQEEYRPGCGPHKRDEKKDFEAVAKLLMKEKTFTSAFIQKSLAMSYFNVQQILGKMEKLGMVSPENRTPDLSNAIHTDSRLNDCKSIY